MPRLVSARCRNCSASRTRLSTSAIPNDLPRPWLRRARTRARSSSRPSRSTHSSSGATRPGEERRARGARDARDGASRAVEDHGPGRPISAAGHVRTTFDPTDVLQGREDPRRHPAGVPARRSDRPRRRRRAEDALARAAEDPAAARARRGQVRLADGDHEARSARPVHSERRPCGQDARWRWRASSRRRSPTRPRRATRRQRASTTSRSTSSGSSSSGSSCCSFDAKGQKPDVAVELHPGDDAVSFGGPLEFVNELRNLIPSNGFSDPPESDGDAERHRRELLAEPARVQVGIFTLSERLARRGIHPAVRLEAGDRCGSTSPSASIPSA